METTDKKTFARYPSLKRFGRDEVRDIEIGEVYVFPKLDGSNASVWFNGEEVCAGSRNRQLSEDADNHGFWAWVTGDSEDAVVLRTFCENNPNLVIYGEWLVPHSLKTYRDDAWRKFWVFDVWDRGSGRFWPFPDYNEVIKNAGYTSVIQPLARAQTPTLDQLHTMLAENTYLVEDNKGVGEGIVVKNYNWGGNYGTITWAKIVSNEFQERNAEEFGHKEFKQQSLIEDEIANKLVTPAVVGKVRGKMVATFAEKMGVDVADPNGVKQVEEAWRSSLIPALLSGVYKEVIEDLWEFVGRKNPTINFKLLRGMVIKRVKELAIDLF